MALPAADDSCFLPQNPSATASSGTLGPKRTPAHVFPNVIQEDLWFPCSFLPARSLHCHSTLLSVHDAPAMFFHPPRWQLGCGRPGATLAPDRLAPRPNRKLASSVTLYPDPKFWVRGLLLIRPSPSAAVTSPGIPFPTIYRGVSPGGQ
jgi:hypothetical protein